MERWAEDAVTQMAKRLAAIEPALDEVARQRIFVRILASIAAGEARTVRIRRWSTLAAVAALALAAHWLWPRERPREPIARPSPQLQRREATPPASAEPPTLRPYLVSGTDRAHAEQLLDRATSRIELKAGERVLSALGDRARVALEGPALLVVRGASRERVELGLERGLLLVDYDRSRGGELGVYSPQARTEVVGTLFSVRADGGTSRVAVAHGVVRVHAADRLTTLASSQALVAPAPAVLVASAAEERALRDHARSLTPPTGEYGVVGVTGARLRAEISGQLLAETPLWALLPVGANTITLRDAARRERALQSVVHARGRTEVMLQDDLAVDGAPRAAAAPRRAAEDAAAARPVTPAAPSGPAPDELYRAAEAAMRASELRRATAILSELVRDHPQAPNVDLALYELAQLAFRAADYGSAQDWLTRLTARGARAALREPAHYLRCKLAQARARAAEHEACLQEFRATFPASPRRSEVLAALAALRFDRDGCAAKALLDEYLAAEPRGPYAEGLRRRRQQCR